MVLQQRCLSTKKEAQPHLWSLLADIGTCASMCQAQCLINLDDVFGNPLGTLHGSDPSRIEILQVALQSDCAQRLLQRTLPGDLACGSSQKELAEYNLVPLRHAPCKTIWSFSCSDIFSI